MKKSWLVIAVVVSVGGIFWARKAGVRFEYPTAHSETRWHEPAPDPKQKYRVRAKRARASIADKKSEVINTTAADPKAAPSHEKKEATKELTSDEIYCQLIAGKSGVPLGGRVRIQTISMDSPDGGVDSAYLVQSSECPLGLFSVVYTTPEGKLAGETSCNETNAKNLALDLGVQAEVVDTNPPPNEVDLAITGPGSFVVECETGLHVNRLGRFARDDEGFLRDDAGCRLLSRPTSDSSANEPMRLEHGQTLNAQGCLADGSCVGVADPRDLDRDGVELIDNKSFSVASLKSSSFLTPKIASDALEDIEDSDRGPGGWKGWDSIEPVPSNLRCAGN